MDQISLHRVPRVGIDYRDIHTGRRFLSDAQLAALHSRLFGGRS